MTDYRLPASTDDNASMMDAFGNFDLTSFWPAPPLSSSASSSTSTTANHQLSPPLFEEDLQQRLQALIEGDRESWTYAIFWRSSSGGSLLGWGDGFYKGEEYKGKRKAAAPSSAEEQEHFEQEHRKKVLRELNYLISGASPSSSEDTVDEEVTDTEWFFLVSMAQSFVNGSGLPGQAFFNSSPIWVAGADRLASSRCERARHGQVLGLQTMVCIPSVTGVVELGSTELIIQNPDLMTKINPDENDPSTLYITDPSSIEIRETVNTTTPVSIPPRNCYH